MTARSLLAECEQLNLPNLGCNQVGSLAGNFKFSYGIMFCLTMQELHHIWQMQ